MARPTRQVLESWIEAINENGQNLTKWEETFMESVNEKIDDGSFISENMEQHIERIYAQRTR